MAGGEGCRDERRGSSASEVGTNDGTAKKKKKKKRNSLNLVHNKSITKSVFYFMSVHSKVILGNKQLEQLNVWKWVNLYLQVAHRTLFDDGKSVRLRK